MYPLPMIATHWGSHSSLRAWSEVNTVLPSIGMPGWVVVVSCVCMEGGAVLCVCVVLLDSPLRPAVRVLLPFGVAQPIRVRCGVVVCVLCVLCCVGQDNTAQLNTQPRCCVHGAIMCSTRWRESGAWPLGVHVCLHQCMRACACARCPATNQLSTSGGPIPPWHGCH